MKKESNWDAYRRMQCNLEKAQQNQEVATLTTKHYQLLWQELVKTPEDEDVFNDAYLKLTYKYNPSMDFCDQFRFYFNQLQGAYRRDDAANHFYSMDKLRLEYALPKETNQE